MRTSLVIAVMVLGVALWRVVSRRPSALPTTTSGTVALRDGVLSRALFANVGTDTSRIRGVVMDWNIGTGVATLVAIDDGTVSLYLSSGGGVLGAGTHASVASVASAFRAEAERQRGAFAPVSEWPLPGENTIVFYVLTNAATLSSGAITADAIQRSDHALSELGATAQALLAEVGKTQGAQK